MDLDVFQLHDDAPPIVPARPERAWMDETGDRFAYRCLPLTMANTSGWEILSPFGFVASWTGGQRASDLRFTVDGRADDAFARFCVSHFAHGILTFHVGYMFRTPPGWALWAMGPPNAPKHGVQPLAGVVETDWLPFPFTMNWRMTAPGSVRFEKGEPVAFLTLAPHAALDDVVPVLRRLDDDPDLAAQYQAWLSSRTDFLARLGERDPRTVREAWQRHYFRGQRPDDPTPQPDHVHRRRMRPVMPRQP